MVDHAELAETRGAGDVDPDHLAGRHGRGEPERDAARAAADVVERHPRPRVRQQAGRIVSGRTQPHDRVDLWVVAVAFGRARSSCVRSTRYSLRMPSPLASQWRPKNGGYPATPPWPSTGAPTRKRLTGRFDRFEGPLGE
jgi:hypothetical protein